MSSDLSIENEESVQLTPNIQLFEEVLAEIKTQPEQWNQSNWHCGTQHCLAGWVELKVLGKSRTQTPLGRYSHETMPQELKDFLEPHIRRLFHYEIKHYFHGEVWDFVNATEIETFTRRIAQWALGLTDAQSALLFFPSVSRKHVETPGELKERFYQIIEQQKS